jgi:hypothetical protein
VHVVRGIDGLELRAQVGMYVDILGKWAPLIKSRFKDRLHLQLLLRF